MKTRTYVDTIKTLSHSWHLIDVSGKVLGRTTPQIAKLLMGKHKPTYTPNLDSGDYVVVLNAKDIVVTRTKASKKMYYRHSGVPGGFREERFEEVMEKNPARVIEHAVHGMLPKNKMLDIRMGRLKVFAGTEHTY
ncbi:MAG TPA: 50S ribosomal protein L13, partial [Patescibacteria group bacterium]|nr:50S ribosomal protein L13 [Patescibacteria group bacterium]